MRLRFAIFRTETKLLLLRLGELLFLNPIALLLIIEFPLFLVIVRVLGGELSSKPILAYGLIFVLAVVVGAVRNRTGETFHDSPLRRSLITYPGLCDMVRQVAKSCHRSPLQHVHLGLSPAPWRQFGVDLNAIRYQERSLTLPVACLDNWSISDLKVHIARSAVSHQGPVWLLRTVELAIERLAGEQFQAEIRGDSSWSARRREQALTRYVTTLATWRLLVDLDGDLRASRVVDPASVTSLAYKTELAQSLGPYFLTNVIEPAIEKKTLLPIATSYSAYASTVEPHWEAALAGALKDLEESPNSPSNPAIIRLAAIASTASKIGAHDPRPASSLFPDLSVIEREVAANELGAERIEHAVDADIASSVRMAVIPQLQDEVNRNQEILGQKTWLDIPRLLMAKRELAAIYRSDPKLLLAEIQREQRIPYLLGAFLALSLIDEQWEVHYDLAEGLQLRAANRCVQPFTLVEQLHAKAISEEDFTSAIT